MHNDSTQTGVRNKSKSKRNNKKRNSSKNLKTLAKSAHSLPQYKSRNRDSKFTIVISETPKGIRSEEGLRVSKQRSES